MQRPGLLVLSDHSMVCPDVVCWQHSASQSLSPTEIEEMG